jgi:hypothetical protein
MPLARPAAVAANPPQITTGQERSADSPHVSPQLEEVSGEPPSWPDEAAESAMVSELRGRGEVVAPPAAAGDAAEAADETEPKGALPPLDELVNKIPAEVRDTLEDLFRARFVTVKRMPKKALK